MADTIVTKVGVAVFPWLGKADTKFKKGGEFKTNLRFDREDVKDLLEKIDEAHADAIKNAHAEREEKLKELPPAKAKKLKKIDENEPPYEDVLDDDGNETGEVDLKFRKNASYEDKKTGETKRLTLPMRDSNGEIVKGLNPWGGTRLRVAFEIREYYVPANGMAGVRLNMKQVQIIELVDAESGGSNPFDEVEGGYTKSHDKDDDNAFADADEDGADDGEAEDHDDF